MHQVDWLKTSLDELAGIWLAADSEARTAIASATQEIDRLLQADPFNQGESREADQRVMFMAPLGLTYELHFRRF